MVEKQVEMLRQLRLGDINNYFTDSKLNEYITEKKLGKLYLPTGKIVANDPLCMFEDEAFQKCIPPGSYEVVLYIHHIEDDCRVAFAEIQFSDHIPNSFELATIEGQHMESLDDDEYFGYGVDSGTGSFMDKATCDAIDKLMQDSEDDDDVITRLECSLDESYVDTYSTANFTLPDSRNNLVAFSSGYGDGCYASFWGYDEKGELCSLITDFLTVDDDEEVEEVKPAKDSFFDRIKGFFKTKS